MEKKTSFLLFNNVSHKLVTMIRDKVDNLASLQLADTIDFSTIVLDQQVNDNRRLIVYEKNGETYLRDNFGQFMRVKCYDKQN